MHSHMADLVGDKEYAFRFAPCIFAAYGPSLFIEERSRPLQSWILDGQPHKFQFMVLDGGRDQRSWAERIRSGGNRRLMQADCFSADWLECVHALQAQ